MSLTLDLETPLEARGRRLQRRRDRPEGMTITELADHLGATVRALRYYEEARLLRPDRTGGNARRYGAETRRRAELIVALRNLGVPLKSIENVIDQNGDLDAQVLTAIIADCRRDALERLRSVESLARSMKIDIFVRR